MKPRILVLTDISQLDEVQTTLESIGEVISAQDMLTSDIASLVKETDYIFTNPNKSTIYLGWKVLSEAKNLKAICTASTGLTHIDADYCLSRGIKIISLRNERELLSQLPSTAELALGLTLNGLRNIPGATRDVEAGNWDYRKWMGSQMKGQSVGVVGLGRLGRMYADFCASMGANVSYFDPFIQWDAPFRRIASPHQLFEENRVVSLHAHVENGSGKIVTSDVLKVARSDLILVNTARGELVDESALLSFLTQNPSSQYLADVLSEEHAISDNLILEAVHIGSSQITLTPHVGGMTKEGQKLAYIYAAERLAKIVNTLGKL